MTTKTTKVWNLMYRMGTTGRVISSADNPVPRKVALEGAAVVTKTAGGCGLNITHPARFFTVTLQRQVISGRLLPNG